MVKKILLFFILLSFGITICHVALAQSERNCNLKQICAQPGDYLKYTAQVYGHNGTISYNFGNLIDPNTIKISISTLVGGQTINGQSVLNLKNTTLINSDGSKGAFFFMVLTPINPNEVTASPFKEATGMFNGYQRSIYAIEESNGTDFQEVKVDKETGVLLDFKVVHAQMISGQQVVTGTSFVLADTNIITSSDFQGTNESSSFVPQAINNTASVPNSVFNAPNSNSGSDTTIIYIGIAIAAGAGAVIMIMRKRKHKIA
ncbi:MAG: hypothetical protein ACREA3_04825 [Nitrosotalea sp.]